VTALAADLTRDQHRTKVMAMIGSSIGLVFALSLVAAPAALCRDRHERPVLADRRCWPWRRSSWCARSCPSRRRPNTTSTTRSASSTCCSTRS
jgi:hypothetical protein